MVISTLELQDLPEAALIENHLNFDLCRALIRVFRLPVEKIDQAEQNQASMVDFISSYFEIIEDTLKPMEITNRE